MTTQVSGRKRTLREAVEDDVKSPEKAPQTGSDFSVEYLKIYYNRLFPFQDVFNWLSYFHDPARKSEYPNINVKYWRNREWSFTLKDDIYIRFKSYNDINDFRKDLIQKNPFKIDIGAVYNVEPMRKATISSENFIPEEKELVFDIDISDYDDVRTCCQEASICNKCWPLMSCAVKVIDRALREDFGFEHLFWVFSGRRGIHCWVCDPLPRRFDTQGRSAILDYLKCYNGNSHSSIKCDLNVDRVQSIHNSLRAAYAICLRYFRKCSLEQQEILSTEEGINYFVGMIRDSDLKIKMKQALYDTIHETDGNEKWTLIDSIFQDFENKMKSPKDKRKIQANKMEVVFAYVYPRLDVEVSRHMNHLLKSPFCVHPKTGKVCTIIDPQHVDSFDPLKQPTLPVLMDELNAFGSGATWEQTSMNEVVQTFRRTFLDKMEQQQMAIILGQVPQEL